LQAFAGARVLLPAYSLALLVQQDAVAAPEGGKWADQVQALGSAFQTLTALLQLVLHRTRKTLAQQSKAFMQQPQHAFRMLVLQPTLEVVQLQPALLQALPPGPLQSHVQLVEALTLLGQTLARVAQASPQSFKAKAVLTQAGLHALLQLALEALELPEHR